MKYHNITEDVLGLQNNAELSLIEHSVHIFNSLSDIIWVWDAVNKTVIFSQRWSEISGYTSLKVHLSLELLASVIHNDNFEEISNYFIRAESGEFISIKSEFRIKAKNENYIWLSCNGSTESSNDTLTGIISGSLRDISYQKSLEETLRYANDYDTVTGLSSYRIIEEQLNLIAKQKETNRNSTCAVLIIDLDDFRTIRDTYGVLVGNQLLKLTGNRINECIRESDMVSRIDGDQFIILLSDIDEQLSSQNIAARILDKIEKPFFVLGHELYTSASIGIVLLPFECESTHEIIKNCNSALNAAKANGKNQYQFFREKLNTKQINRYNIETELRHSLENNELQIYYQPIVKGRTGKIVGVEALLRWNNPNRGILLPDDFIQIAEKTGLIIPIGNNILNAVCTQTKNWHRKGYLNLYAAVNISVIQLSQPDFVNIVKNALEQADLNPKYLELEITESVFVESIKKATKTLDELKNLGIRIVLDDFGTAYSSLNYLKSLPIDKIKIDKSFTSDINKSPKNEAIISAMITLSNKMHIDIVAEGIETINQLNYLVEQGCELIQGYLFSKPLPVEEIDEVIKKAEIEINLGTSYYQI